VQRLQHQLKRLLQQQRAAHKAVPLHAQQPAGPGQKVHPGKSHMSSSVTGDNSSVTPGTSGSSSNPNGAPQAPKYLKSPAPKSPATGVPSGPPTGGPAAGDEQQMLQAAADAAAQALRQQLLQAAGAVQQLCLKLAEALVPAAMACIQLEDPGSAAGLHSWATGVLLPAMAAAHQGQLQQQQQQQQQQAASPGSSSSAGGAEAAEGDDSGSRTFTSITQRAGASSGMPATGSSSSSSSSSSSVAAAYDAAQVSWLAGVVAQAAGRYEAAVLWYQHFLTSGASMMWLGRAAGDLVLMQLARCFAATSDWEGLQRLASQLQGKALATADPTLNYPAVSGLASGAAVPTPDAAAASAGWVPIVRAVPGAASEGPALLTRPSRPTSVSQAVLTRWVEGWVLAGAQGYSQLVSWNTWQQQQQQQDGASGRRSVFLCLTDAQELLLEGLAVWQQPEGPSQVPLRCRWGFQSSSTAGTAATTQSGADAPLGATSGSSSSSSSRGRGRGRGRGASQVPDSEGPAGTALHPAHLPRLPDGTLQHILHLLGVARKLPEQLLGSYSGARGLWLGQGAVLEQLGQASVVEGLLQHMQSLDAASDTVAAAAARGGRRNGAAVAGAALDGAGVLLPWVAVFQQPTRVGMTATTTTTSSGSSSSSSGGHTTAGVPDGSPLWQQVLTAAGDVPDTGPLQLPQLLQVLQLLQAECHPARGGPASRATTTAASGVSSSCYQQQQQQEVALLVLSAVAAHRGGCGEAAQALLQVAMAAAPDGEHKGWLQVRLCRGPFS
jgi:hypothetical protein